MLSIRELDTAGSQKFPAGSRFTYGQQVNPDRLPNGFVKFLVYMDGSGIPFDQVTYYLR